MPIRTIIANASGLAINDAFERVIASHIPNKRLIGNRNYYKRNTKGRMDSATNANLRKNQIEEYIASSVFIHCSDGWSYISRAIESLLNGDIASAIHFAYYSELRSSMSLMAYEGIGIFNRQHIYFDVTKTPILFRNFTTHSAADKGMKQWAKIPKKKDVIFKLLSVNNRTFVDWIRETGFGPKSPYAVSVVNRWLKKWSIDLHLYDDQQLRNEMSYRPHFERNAVDCENTIDRLSQIWSLLEPTGGDRFPRLDQYLLRIALEEVFRKSTGTEPIGVAFQTFITQIFGRLGEDTTQRLYEFLLRRIEPDDAILFVEARKDSANIDVNREDPFPILCRAILLLRLCTGAANRLIADSSVNIKNLRYWWEDLAFKHGYLSTIPSGVDTIDLYTDVRDSLSEISNLPAGSLNSIKDAFSNISQPLAYLKQFQRSAFWGMGL